MKASTSSITLEVKWGTSRGRDSYGYALCTLYADGRKAARCNGGGYDMKGTVMGNWLAAAFADRLLRLKPEHMPHQKHWQSARNPRRVCRSESCVVAAIKAETELPRLAPDVLTCPVCGEETHIDHQDGQTIDDGRHFYGLSFHDPDYNPGKAIVGKDCQDRTFGKDGENAGKTVEQAEQEGMSAGLERYQAFYTASSPHPTKRHRVPLIDGACGLSSVEQIGRAIGVTLEWHATRSKSVDIYTAHVRDHWRPTNTSGCER
jgi:hypothetical protein